MRRPVGVKWIRFGFYWSRCFFLAESPLSPCFHPHSRGAIRFARCTLGVLVSADAAICLAPCGSVLAEWNLGQAINAVTGTRLWLFDFPLPGTVSTLFWVLSYAAAGSATGLQLRNGSYTSPLTHR
jgi:hypothetical protein